MTELYDPMRPELVAGRQRARGVLARYNAAPEEQLLRELFARVGAEAFVALTYSLPHELEPGRRTLATT